MTDISAGLVVKLRERTGVGMMQCKRALQETKGDLDAATDVLRKKGLAKAIDKGGREAREGVIAQSILPGAHTGVLVEVNCETDFVAKNESFRAFADEVARALAQDPNADLEAKRVDQVTKIGENIKISRSQRLEIDGVGLVAAYIHTGAKVGVLVEVGADKETTVGRDEFKSYVKDITLQVAAATPVTVSRDEVDPAVIEKEKEIAAGQVKGKPPHAIEKIVQGKLEKYFQGVCLLEQGFIKNPEITVKEHQSQVARQLEDEIRVRRFVRFQVGKA